MKCSKLLLITGLAISVIACHQSHPLPETALDQVEELLRKKNIRNFHQREENVIEEYNFEGTEPKLQHTLKQLSGLLTLHTGFDSALHHPEDVIAIDEFIQTFRSEVDRLASECYQPGYLEDRDDLYDSIAFFQTFNAHADSWKSRHDPYTLALLRLEALNLESILMDSYFSCHFKGKGISDYFHGLVHFYPKRDTVKAGEEWVAVVDMEAYLTEKHTIENPQFRYSKMDENLDKPFEHDGLMMELPTLKIEPFGSEDWLIRFQPEAPGLYVLSVTIPISTRGVEYVILPFRGWRPIVVE